MSAPFMLIGMSRLCLAFEDSLKAGPSLLIPAPGTDVGHHAPSMVNQPSVAPLYAAQYGVPSLVLARQSTTLVSITGPHHILPSPFFRLQCRPHVPHPPAVFFSIFGLVPAAAWGRAHPQFGCGVVWWWCCSARNPGDQSFANPTFFNDARATSGKLLKPSFARIEELCEGGSSTPSTPHSHDYEPCLGGQSHGQGAPVYSCGCYRRTKVEPALALADALADVSKHQELERDVDSLTTQVGGRSSDSEIRPLKHKRSTMASESDSVGGTTPHRFGRNLTNVQRAQSVPALEAPKLLNVVKCLEAAIDRQTEVLSKIHRILEGSAK
ncbi:uncharacterized protein HD556DRAFT_1447887 [Suillus plorans]|uniref:Uncharacterized protein n=1 Tax=Suillus plorans TaxID=116603 RepID=A0A9P7AHD3_9AGAM|nr:uncharacterized protein HD556DRAFT_1447887 [Suillus plorans]KAG1788495.1 hypothetical protein HD556DRAFT_1447887 [Suillus plorans]